MTGDNYGFFWDDLGGDRLYSADSMEKWLTPFFTTGVFNGQLQVTADTGMTITVSAGYGNVNGKVIKFNGDTSLNVPVASGINDRIDAVVLERNDSDRILELKIIEGTVASNPVAPAPTRTGAVYQLVLAHIYVGMGVTEITQANITDKRMDADLCGYVAATVEEIDFSQIAAQFESWSGQYESSAETWIQEFENVSEADFEYWLRHLKSELDANQAANLQRQIDEIKSDLSDLNNFGVMYDEITDENGESLTDESNNGLEASNIFVRYAQYDTGGNA